MDDAEIAAVARDYTPLVRATAHRYCGRGAEFEDLARRIWKNWSMHAPAERGVDDPLDVVSEVLRDPESEREYDEIDVLEVLDRCLDPDERALADALLAGYSQRELARRLGVSPQTVNNRVALLRGRLRSRIAVPRHAGRNES